MSKSISSGSRSHVRILLVEDNEPNRRLLGDYLKHIGYDVLSMADGSQFFDAIAQFQPHVVLLDLKLPDVDGYSLLWQLKQTPHLRQLPVIVVSAFAFEVDKRRAIELGAFKYIVKPLRFEHLNQAIQEAVGPIAHVS